MKKGKIVFVLLLAMVLPLTGCASRSAPLVPLTGTGEALSPAPVTESVTPTGDGAPEPETPTVERTAVADSDPSEPSTAIPGTTEPESLTADFGTTEPESLTADFETTEAEPPTGELILDETTGSGELPEGPMSDEPTGTEEPPQLRRISVELDLPGSAVLSGGDAIQTLAAGEPYIPVTVTPAYGYRFLGYEIQGQRYESPVIDPVELSGDVQIKVLCAPATDEIPAIRIDTDGAPINSKLTYTEMTFSMQDGAETILSATGGVRLRGNSTLGYDKKAYRIKFDKKQSLFGLTKAKSWVLLADYLDPSSLHNYTAFTLASYSDGIAFTPTPHHVNLYVNGEYRGLYLLCEQVQENEGRVNIEQKITTDMTDLRDYNFLICMDASTAGDQDAVLDETYFLLDEENDSRCFELKYPEKADFPSEEQFRSFFDQLKAYVNEVYRAFREQDEEAIRSFADLTSLADFLLIDQIMGNADHATKSFYLYQTAAPDADSPAILHFGPIWDYDFALYNPWTGSPNVCYDVSDSVNYFPNVFFMAMANIPAFDGLVRQRWSEWASDALTETVSVVHAEEARIAESLALDAALWYEDGDDDVDGDIVADIVRDNIDFLYAFLARRQELLGARWAS